MNVLISLHKGYGLGDAVQMSAVLRHIVKARPHWIIDYQAEEGRHQVGRGIVANTFAYGNKYPSDYYDVEAQIVLYDTWSNWGDRPNTRVSSCLHERFGLEWDRECSRYMVEVTQQAITAVDALINHKGLFPNGAVRSSYVALHYQGDSSQTRKDLKEDDANSICEMIESIWHSPLILDWRHRSRLPYRRLRTPQHWGGDAEMVCAIIRQCRAFIGIDSGPSKCASSTDTPTLVIWTGHHPAPFHDPAPNTTHLVPVGYHGLEPVCNDKGVIRWFEENYNVRQYNGNLTTKVRDWLEEVLQ
jgi:hypothetical protein